MASSEDSIAAQRATVAVYPFRSDAEIAVARLAADGIDAVVYQDDEGGLNPGFFRRYGVRVEVSADDLPDAWESLGIETIEVPGPVAEAMFRHAGFCHPQEACGLVGFDRSAQPAFVFCCTNADASAHRFTIDPVEHHGGQRLAERLGLTIGGVFHSHVRSEAYPSSTDLEGGADPAWLQFIVGPVVGRRPALRVFRIHDGDVVELSVTVAE